MQSKSLTLCALHARVFQICLNFMSSSIINSLLTCTVSSTAMMTWNQGTTLHWDQEKFRCFDSILAGTCLENFGTIQDTHKKLFLLFSSSRCNSDSFCSSDSNIGLLCTTCSNDGVLWSVNNGWLWSTQRERCKCKRQGKGELHVCDGRQRFSKM